MIQLLLISILAMHVLKNLLINEILKTDGFEQQAEILCKVVKNGKKFYEVPINYNGRSHDEGKKLNFIIFLVLYIKY